MQWWCNVEVNCYEDPKELATQIDNKIEEIQRRYPSSTAKSVPSGQIDEEIQTIIHGIRAFASYGVGARIYGDGVDDIHLQRAITAANNIAALLKKES